MSLKIISGLPVSVDNACAARNVPYYFLSHFHADHLRGLKNGAESFDFGFDLVEQCIVCVDTLCCLDAGQDGRMGPYSVRKQHGTCCW